ncbi:hypothetical protein AV903_12295 [Erwinia tracheiphila]|uniref:Uncharacterized protein n=1 Tax=Erwinia tracheiphila TaxID=65700 RepID=A0A345CRM2_9GAMM|nr:hypothetical protein AV903_08545 [Erwinia tracheiphila]AXF76645.1 hypothetical protein AV903_12295 [Erwinia tracheiphila]
MGTPTGNYVTFTKGLGRGSDYFGPCEVCGKHVSETFVARVKREWKRENGELYYGCAPSLYGHEKCVTKR